MKDLLNKHHASLGEILVKANYLQILNKHFIAQLDPPLQPYCRIANLREHTLVIAVANASIATRLRYATPAVLAKLKQLPEFADIATLQLYIAPQALAPLHADDRGHTHLSLSPENAELLRQTAATIKDERLKQALARLAAPNRKSVN